MKKNDEDIIKELYRKGYSINKIVKEYKYSKATIYKYLKKWKEDYEISRIKTPNNNTKKTTDSQSIKNNIKKRRKKVKELYRTMTIKELADVLGVSSNTVCVDIKYLKEKGEIAVKERKKEEQELTYKMVDKLCDEFYGQHKTLVQFKRFISDCREKYRNGNLKMEELQTLKKVVELTDNYADTIFYIKICIKLGLISDAKKIVNNKINDSNLNEEEKNKMRDLKKEIRLIEQKVIALKVLNSKGNVQQAMYYSGLPEIEVIKLKPKPPKEIKNNKEEYEKSE